MERSRCRHIDTEKGAAIGCTYDATNTTLMLVGRRHFHFAITLARFASTNSGGNNPQRQQNNSYAAYPRRDGRDRRLAGIDLQSVIARFGDFQHNKAHCTGLKGYRSIVQCYLQKGIVCKGHARKPGPVGGELYRYPAHIQLVVADGNTWLR